MIFLNFLIAFCVGLITWAVSGHFWAGFVLSVAWMVLWWAIRFKEARK